MVILPKLSIKDEYKKILEYLEKNFVITREEVEKILGIKRNASVDLLNEMVTRNLIIKEGKSRNIIYKLK